MSQTDLHLYHVFYSTVTGSNNHKTLLVNRGYRWPTSLVVSMVEMDRNMSKFWNFVLVHFTDNVLTILDLSFCKKNVCMFVYAKMVSKRST